MNPLSRVLFVTALPLALVTFNADADVSTFLSKGDTCGHANNAELPGKGAVRVSVCVSTTTEWLCGSTTKFQAANAGESGKLKITAIQYAAKIADPNTNVKLPLPITHSPPTADLGSTTNGKSEPPGANQLLAIYDIAAAGDADKDEYVVSLASDSSLGISKDNSCANATDAPMAASFTLTRKDADAKPESRRKY